MASMQLSAGNACMLVLAGRRHYCGIAAVEDDCLRLHFPFPGLPLENMEAEIECYDEEGCTTYRAVILEEPGEQTAGLLLRYEPESRRVIHRAWWRIPADFAAQLKSHVHPRKHWVAVNDISLGGMQVLTSADLALGDSVDLTFTVPGSPEPDVVLSEVIHVGKEIEDEHGTRRIGLHFQSVDALLQRKLKSYVWRRLREMHPEVFARKTEPQEAFS